MKNKFRETRTRIENCLRIICGQMTPRKRLVTILILFFLFAATNIYITVRAIYNIGREDARREMIELEHIERLKTDPPQTPDNQNPFNQKQDERPEQ